MAALPEVMKRATTFPRYSAQLTLDATLFFGSVES